MHVYDNTLCSLTMKRPDRPLVPQGRHWRPSVDAFADITPIDESTLIEKNQLLDAIADDDDDIDYIRGFARAPETAEEPLQRIYRHILYIGPVPTRTGRANGYLNRSNEVGGAPQPPPTSTPFC